MDPQRFDNNNEYCDANEARRRYKINRRSNKRFYITAAAFCAVVILLLILCIVGVVNVFSNSRSSYENAVEDLYQRSLEGRVDTLEGKEASIADRWDENARIVKRALDRAYNDYINEEITYAQLCDALDSFSLIDQAAEYCDDLRQKAEPVNTGRENLKKAKDYKIQGDSFSALMMYLTVPENDILYYKSSVGMAQSLRNECNADIAAEVNGYLAKYDISGANAYINQLADKLGGDDFIESELDRIKKFNDFQTDVVSYSGPIEHVFTHCLIAFPELCYSSPSMTASLDEDCVTPSEFSKIIQALYEKDYILIDINSLMVENEDGSVSMAELAFPKGKKPLVLSIDDVTYDSRKMHTGMVDKLIVDDEGRICTYTKHLDGTEVVSYENEVFPIIDEFVRKHPDFSFRGARGTLCHTGFDGVFGYRTQNEPKEDVDSEKEREAALKVAAALKAEGWTFASHSYGHAQMHQSSFDYIKRDTDNWINEVTAIIGDTKIMVWPYGGSIRSGEAHDYLYNAGFRLFCGVGVDPFFVYEADGKSLFMDRKALDGYSLRNRRQRYMYLFDTEEVWDPLRPKEITW